MRPALIPAHMFEGSGVTALTLGAGVTEIGESAFANTALKTAEMTERSRHRRGRVCQHRADERRPAAGRRHR